MNNPTNAPHNPLLPMPFSSQRHVAAIAKRREKGDLFDQGKDYRDEGYLLLTTELAAVKYRPSIAHVPGYGSLSTEDIEGLSRMDESAQGQHIHYLDKAVVADVDIKLITSSTEEMRDGVFREAHYPNMETWVHSKQYTKLRESQLLLRNAVKHAQKTSFSDNGRKGIVLRESAAKVFRDLDKTIVKRLREAPGTSFDTGRDAFAVDDPPLRSLDVTGAGRDLEFIPLLAGPFNKQLYWADYLDMHSKAFEAWTHNPLAKRICKIIPQFVLGKGVKATVITAEMETGKAVTDPDTGEPGEEVEDFREEVQAVIDTHWRKNNMVMRSKEILRDLIIFGEQFIRYFQAPWGLKVRQIDPSTVWEVVADPDDAETEFYLHQQYPTRYQWYVDLPIPTIKFIIRQVPAKNYYHFKINTVAGEIRGRSELFAVLGWLKRLKEFATDRVIRNKMGNLFVMDVSVEGGPTEVAAAKTMFATPPTPGSFYIHNKAAELKGIRAEIGAGDVTSDWEMLLTILSAGAGLSKEYLAYGSAGTKAQALIGTEPDIKTFEDYQECMEVFFQQDCDRAIERAKEMNKLPRNLVCKIEFTYPALEDENRSEKMKDIAFAESMSWISHRRGASMGAKELQVTSFDYDEEIAAIAAEDAKQNVLINKAYIQSQKGKVEQAEGGGGPPGGGAPASGPAGEAKKNGGWRGADPRAVREGILREAANLQRRKRMSRKRDAVLTPHRKRDQKDMSRRDKITKGRRALKGNYNESKEAREPFKKGDGQQIQNPQVVATPGHYGRKASKKRKDVSVDAPNPRQGE